MTKVLVDALYPAGIPLTFGVDVIMASYVDHPEVSPACMVQLRERFPQNPLVTIAAHGGDAMICDVENGAMVAADVPHWLNRQREQGRPGVCYASPATWPSVQQACASMHVAFPYWWAVVRGPQPFIPAGADGNQWLGAGPYDQSLITDELYGALIMALDPTDIADIASQSAADVAGYMITAPGSTDPAASRSIGWVLNHIWGQVDANAAAIVKLQAVEGGVVNAPNYTGIVTLAPSAPTA